ncbi:alpha/beta hydrolase [Paractinoplanes deccanensis]|uniref:Alpha/beta hydrolase n=1 Tax=Paractinoplanes deccanensis TaxID=113561 RepID=A0ABQ3Y9S4_9ACTN|nr:alpha/beta fold hydrolase [Actinoplanes deccanensis]GID76760.1 alpha/beta hydrolase [Actinoplanes deccanensis]
MKSLLVLAMVAAGPIPAATGTPTLRWHPCPSASRAVPASPSGTASHTAPAGSVASAELIECASLTVPVDWQRPHGQTFELAVARHRAPDPAKRVGTLVFGPGGPGDSGVSQVTQRITRFSERLRDRFDIVSFDPRGVGGSAPMTCDPVLLKSGPAPVLESAGDYQATVEHNQALWKDCAARTGPVWDHADTLSTVRDVDALRRALGERQISFHGSSYGTLLGQEYASRYPGRVRAMVLESVTDHSSRSTASFLSAQAWALEDAFDDFAREQPGTRQVWQRLYADPGRAGITRFDLVAITHKLIKDGEYARLADLLRAMDGGAPGQSVGKLSVVIPAFCADWSLPVHSYADYQRLLRVASRAAPDTHFPAQVFALTTCLGWPHVANPQHDLSVRTKTPLLLLNSRHDPATGVNWARSVERRLGPRGVLVTYEGTGHASSTRSTCMRDVADAYLIDLTVPPRGTSCPRLP